MKKRIISLILTFSLLVVALPMSIVAAETFTYKVSATTTSPSIGSEFDVVISLTNYKSIADEIRGLQIDVTNIDTSVFEIVSHTTMINDKSAASDKTTYLSNKNNIRYVYLQLSGSMDKSVTDVMKFRLKVKDDLSNDGTITMPITIKIGTMSENITLTDSLTINYQKSNIPQLKFAGASLSLQHNLTINYKVDKSLFESAGYTKPYAVFKLNGVTTKVSEYTVSGNTYVFTFRNIAPNQMNDSIYATLYATYDGEEYASATREYSVAEYCYNMLNKCSDDEYAKFRTLLVDLLNYGAASQTYTDYKTDALVNASLTASQKQLGTSKEPAMNTVFNSSYKVVDNPTAKWKGAALNLNNSVSMRLKFTADNIEGLTVKVKTDKNTWSISSDKFIKDDNAYYVYFNGLNAGQMRENVYLTIYNGSTPVSNTVCYSIGSYAYEKQNSTVAGLSELVKAMMKYGDSAYAYAN